MICHNLDPTDLMFGTIISLFLHAILFRLSSYEIVIPD